MSFDSEVSPIFSESLTSRSTSTSALFFQRVLDIAVAIPALVALLPLMVTVTLIVWMGDGAWPFFGHKRIGRHGVTFKCWKFRSMVPNAEKVLHDYLAENAAARVEWAADHKLRNDPRITSAGRFIRASSLDELPQLFNVLLGEMSLVGPRPIIPAEVHRYGEDFDHYCRCRPGITGLWQISGRNDVSYKERVSLDVRYSQSRNIGMDLKILVATIPAVLTRRGSY